MRDKWRKFKLSRILSLISLGYVKITEASLIRLCTLLKEAKSLWVDYCGALRVSQYRAFQIP